MAQDWVIFLDKAEEAGITAAANDDPCWDGYKQVGMKKKNGKMVPNCVPINASDESEESEFTAGSKPAPKKDQIKGSSKNSKGSASGSKKIVFSKATEKTLHEKVVEHNKKAPEGRKASLSMLKAVYRRGAGAFSGSHRPGMNRNQWAMGRVNAFLKLLRSGRPKNSAYKSDNDLLPKSHPRSLENIDSVTASGIDAYELELTITVGEKESYTYPEDAILALTEYSGYGYEAESAIRASWLRAVRNNEDPFVRASILASLGTSSLDADLLPKIEDTEDNE